MNRVLFVASAVSYFREMAPVVWHFADQGWQVRVLLGSSGAISDDVVSQCCARGIVVDITPPNVGYGSAEALVASSQPAREPNFVTESVLWKRIRGAIRSTGLGRFRTIPDEWLRMRRVRRYADEFIANAQPDVVFQGPYHSVGQIDNGIARSCCQRNIRRYCLPNSGYLGGKILSVGRSTHLKTGMASSSILTDNNWINRLFAQLTPSWISRLPDGRRAFYWDPLLVLTSRISGLFFDRLWTKPAVDFDRVFVFSEYSASLLKDDAYPMEKVIISGQPLLDSVWARSLNHDGQKQIFAYLRLSPGTPFLLVNIEPSAEHLYCDWERHLSNVRAVLNAVSRHGIPVVLSLHPLCDGRRYTFAEEEYGAFICRNFKIHDLYPLCLLSISFPCSTNLLAEVFKKPLIIYDFFGLTSANADSAFIHALPGAAVATSGAALADFVSKMVAQIPHHIEVIPPSRSACSAIFDTIMDDLSAGINVGARPLLQPPLIQSVEQTGAQSF
jgi:hypothetical protein